MFFNRFLGNAPPAGWSITKEIEKIFAYIRVIRSFIRLIRVKSLF
jgi:hypothetical protein